MKFSKEQIRQAMLLYGITDRSWLKPGEKLSDVCREILEHGVTFLQLREKELDQEAFLKGAVRPVWRSVCGKRQRGDSCSGRGRWRPCGTVRY